jgi:uncharacterized membrane protein
MKIQTQQFKKADILSLGLILFAGIASVYFYRHFPVSVATHWGLNGQPNRYSSRTFTAFFFPTLTLGMYIVLSFLPSIDPHKERYVEFQKIYSIFKVLIVGFLTLIYLLIGINGIGHPIDMSFVTPFLVGILFVVVGNYLGKIKNNWFVGIRNPWTLSSEEVWNRTHRLGGKLFVAAGLVILLDAFLPLRVRFFIFFLAVTTAVIIPTLYSFVIYKK